jgi:hypothetical protein
MLRVFFVLGFQSSKIFVFPFLCHFQRVSLAGSAAVTLPGVFLVKCFFGFARRGSSRPARFFHDLYGKGSVGLWA